ncbi:MAG: hypothetical protein KI786_12835 [Mameliella sp.]|nr:hypothetical protein [Phaeodactylibacter sp.]
MFQSINLRSFFALFVFVTSSITAMANDNDLLITLRAGTPVSLTLNQTISSEDAQIGNVVEFMVRSNVTVNGQVVIAAGSIAEGMVTDVTKTCDNCSADCAKLVISVETVQAVDGQRVYLRSIPMTIKGECCGKCNEPAIGNIGKVVSARVQNDSQIDA